MVSEKSKEDSIQPVPLSDGDVEVLCEEAVVAGDGSIRSEERVIHYVKGYRYWAINFVIASMSFLTTMDMTIAATALVSITDNLGKFEDASWILTSYFLGYVAVIVILAKFSDIFGRKLITIISIIAFTVFSAGCAAAQTTTQLIILRAFQGVGGGGSFAMCATLLIESEPPEKYADAVTRIGVAIVLALVLGPLLGGAISENTTWRWIFLINLPIGALALVIALVGIPKGFPYSNQPQISARSKNVWKRVDVPGAALMLLATLAFAACFQEAGSRFPWKSAYVITLLIVSAVLWICLMVWERYVTLENAIREPVLPWRFFTNRSTLGLFICIILVGAPVAVTNFQLPQRFILINGLSSFDSAIRIIPFGASSAFGTMLSGKLISKLRVPSIYLILVGAVLQVIGFALLGTLNDSRTIQKSVYGYQVLAGLGCAFSFSNLLLLVAFTAEKRDGAVAMGTANQFRALGSAVGLAIVTSVFNNYVGSHLPQLNLRDPAAAIAPSHSQLPLETQYQIRKILSGGYNRQMLTLCALGAAQVPAALLMWRREQVVAAK
ncbi:MFS multidrug transporter-like protein [Dendryphion nanum]|uniref:MFS multidrug transporter-like protein n=1 Tax=Dendryphion nanum TaxID=256645 RepID=A0A9P9E5I3_9PLEO|nr:MFS multidrug transporter-like protein [Dendryphion nanum]